MNSTTLAVTKRCPIHGKALVFDEETGLWRCPVIGCPYGTTATLTPISN